MLLLRQLLLLMQMLACDACFYTAYGMLADTRSMMPHNIVPLSVRLLLAKSAETHLTGQSLFTAGSCPS
jgi:hypothetical protein